MRAGVHRARRTLPIRLLSRRSPRQEKRFVGICIRCGVEFVSAADRGCDAAHVLAVHQLICPGGRRAGEVAIPFGDGE